MSVKLSSTPHDSYSLVAFFFLHHCALIAEPRGPSSPLVTNEVDWAVRAIYLLTFDHAYAFLYLLFFFFLLSLGWLDGGWGCILRHHMEHTVFRTCTDYRTYMDIVSPWDDLRGWLGFKKKRIFILTDSIMYTYFGMYNRCGKYIDCRRAQSVTRPQMVMSIQVVQLPRF